MFSSNLRSRSPWSTIIPSLVNLHLTESNTLIATDLKLPGGIAVLLIADSDDPAGCLKNIDRVMQGGETTDVVVIIFLGGGVWEFQLLLENTFTEPVYLIPLFTPQELKKVLETLLNDFTATHVTTEVERQDNWTPARMLSLMTNTNSNLSPHSTLVLHSLFPSLQALAHGASEYSLEVLDNAEARGIVEFLDVEFIFCG